ncbi:hypothetical protein EHO61_02600 [Leptospira fluminis]|uniref:Uncharacterized protein n=1 Tax=Leptospira fluminis TaxID=2484979 RepID=A0A4R9GRJ8_9LEPT|nr:hypothetical protein [Leptospira fluminis]TGK20778.1 hypothetical protein EHO61_02600 [Leptospira fluminis]
MNPYSIAVASIPFGIFIVVFLFSIRERKRKEGFGFSENRNYFPSIMRGNFSPEIDLEAAVRKLEAGGYRIKKAGQKILFQNASSLQKLRSWFWSYGRLEREGNTVRFRVFSNIGSLLTVPAALAVVVSFGLLVQNNVSRERSSILPFFFLGFAFFFAIATFISQVGKERKEFRKILEK